MRGWRKMTWFILAVQILFLIWIIAGVNEASNNCVDEVGSAKDLCEAGTAVGASIGVGLIIFLWIFVDIVLGLIWLITNRGQRDCPACGHAVKKGNTECRKCGHSFVMNAQQARS